LKVGTKQVTQIDLDPHTEKFILVSDRWLIKRSEAKLETLDTLDSIVEKQ